METKIGIGFSNDVNVEKAAQDAAFESKTNLGTDRIDLAFVLSSIHYSPKQTLPVLHKVLNRSKIIGSSTAGIILSNSIETQGIAVLTLCSDANTYGIGAVHNVTIQNVREMGSSLAQNCLADFGEGRRQLFLTLFDGQIENIQMLIQGAQDVLGNIFPIVGAGSSDDFHFIDNFQIFQNKILRHSATGIILGGQMNFGIGSRHGWKPLGKPRAVTKSTQNIIEKIDSKPASVLYKEFFGEVFDGKDADRFEKMSVLYPLGVFVEGSKEFLLRTAIDIKDDGSIVCQGDVPEGAEIHIMIGNKESCQQAAFEAAQEAKESLLGKDANIILIIESMARLKLLGRMAQNEINEIKNVFGNNIPIIGMYAHGEASPLQTKEEEYKRSLLHSESIVVIAIS